MTREAFRRRLLRLVPGIIATVLVGVAVAVFVRNIGGLIALLGPALGMSESEAAQYAAVFDQLKAAPLDLPLVLTGVLCLPLGMLSCRIVRGSVQADALPARRGGRIAAVTVLWVVLALPLFAVTLWFTDVNDVRFGRVLLVLINALNSGVF